MAESSVVDEYIRKEVEDWEDEGRCVARFKAFSGQRGDWESRYLFWRDLILKVARHLRIFTISPSQVKTNWFKHRGLTPLCLDDVLFLMYNEGKIVRSKDLADPTKGRLSELFRKVTQLMSRASFSELELDDHLILLPLLKDKATEVVQILSESHWTSSCVITVTKLQEICGGPNEASAILSYLSGCGKAQYLTINKNEFIEGVKISLSSSAVCTKTSLDCDVLHLIWTTEKLQQQLKVIDQHYDTLRTVALASLKSGQKKVALRHMRELKLVSTSRDKCASLLSRVEEVLNVIGDAESTKKVSEAIRIGAQAIKANGLEVEEVQLCLQELDNSIDMQRQIEDALESSSHAAIEDDDAEEEYRRLEFELQRDTVQSSSPSARKKKELSKSEAADSSEDLTAALADLKLADVAPKKEKIEHPASSSSREDASTDVGLQAA